MIMTRDEKERLQSLIVKGMNGPIPYESILHPVPRVLYPKIELPSDKILRAYKLVRQKRDGSLGSLFIGRKNDLIIGEWLKAEQIPTKGFAFRPGWHCTLQKNAPHLKMKPKNDVQRVWIEVEVRDYEYYDRPESQGGVWVLAQEMRVLRISN